MLEFNFSGLNTSDRGALEDSFKAKLKELIICFLYKYQKYISDISKVEREVQEKNDVGAILSRLITEIQKIDKKVYLIIDEYDHFANDIIAMGDNDFYREVVRAAGFVRDFYETVKIGTESVIDRIFITGISPIMLDDLTSGFNIASNITMDRNLNEMMGFTDGEIDKIIERVEMKDLFKYREELRKNYNGYLFNKRGNNRIYNPDMVLYFINQYKNFNEYPENLIDDNVKTDYGRLNRLISNRENRRILEEIILNEGIIADIVTRFSFDRMYDEDYFVSLLFYMGLLTIKGTKYGKPKLGMPNYVIKKIFWEYFEKSLKRAYDIRDKTEELAKVIWKTGIDGEIKPFLDYISKNVFKVLSNRDFMKFDEKYIKVVLFSYLTTSNLYRPISEREVENGYIDIYLEKDIRMPEVNYEWIIELKYLKKSERNRLEEVKREGLKQLKGYVDSREFKDRENIKHALIVFIGKDEYEVVEHI